MSDGRARSHFLSEALAWPDPWGLAVDGRAERLADRVHLAGDSAARRTGLLGRDSLPEGEALLLAPCQGIHTFGMRFPIDVVGVGRDGRVRTIVHGLGPRRVALSWRAFAVIELTAGRCRRIGLDVGTLLSPWRPERDGSRAD